MIAGWIKTAATVSKSDLDKLIDLIAKLGTMAKKDGFDALAPYPARLLEASKEIAKAINGQGYAPVVQGTRTDNGGEE
jgi:hypothetical protein